MKNRELKKVHVVTVAFDVPPPCSALPRRAAVATPARDAILVPDADGVGVPLGDGGG